jgi:Zn-dependent M28 family amino/carboxypeptidase
MKKQLLCFLLLSSFALSTAAQKADLTSQNLRKTIEYLASDKLAGRRTGEPGANLAADYIAKQFAAYKLKTSGKTDKNYLQAFPFVIGSALGEANAFEFKSKETGEKIALKLKDEWMPLGFSMSESLENMTLADVGYGISAKSANYDDYRGINVQGCVVLAIDGAPDRKLEQFADLRRKALAAREAGAKALIVLTDIKQEKFAKLEYDNLGDAGLPVVAASAEAFYKAYKLKLLEMGAGITSSDGTEITSDGATVITTKPDSTRVVKKSDGTTFTYKVEIRKEDNNVHTKRADTKTIVKNPDGTIVELEQDYLYHDSVGEKEKDFFVSISVDLNRKTTDAYNVVGILEGTDAKLKNEAIVIGAHYDHLGRGGMGSLAVNSTEIHHGADDNASGVAAMLELARQFSKAKTNKRTLIFIAFSGEEEGLIGSKFYVNNPMFPLDKTVAMINMDMVGRLNENKLTVGGIGTASEWKSLIETINPKADEKVVTVGVENLKLKQYIQDNLKKNYLNNIQVEVKDNRVYLYGFVPKGEITDAVRIAQKVSNKPVYNSIIEESNKNYYPFQSPPFNLQLNEDGFGPSDHSSFYGRQIPVLFFFTGSHVDYHKPSDTADKINYEGLQKVANYVGEIVKLVDGNSTKPTYTVAKSLGMGGGRSGFNVSLGTVPNYAEGKNDGLLLDGVRDDSPAAKAGVKAGDKIIKLAGREVRNISDYVYVLGEMKVGEEYEIVVMRGAETVILKIVPAARK